MFTYGGAANPDLNPEKAFNYETGILHYINKYLTANFTFYWMYLDNEIWFDYTDRRYENYGRTSHLGLESGASLKFCKGLTAFVNYSYTRAQNEAGEDKGKLLTNVPSNKCSFGGSYDTGIGLRASAVVTNVGASYIDPSNSDKLPDYITVDAKFDYNYKGLSLFLIIDNVLNRKYNTYGFKRFGAKYFSPAPGRMFGAGAEVKF
ncbi:MAG: TonB-dependent receptor [Candidatus Omnitrophica bacterium]|nr:TonB-dependent receptor [Candidatus Omnitrophota bacterium]